MHDSQGRIVFAGSTLTGDLGWYRLADRDLSELIVVRESYTELDVRGLVADSSGGSYVLTKTGPRDAGTFTLCHMSDAQLVSCMLVPELGTSDYPTPVAGAGGAVYMIQQARTDVTPAYQLFRFDFPQ